MERDKHHDCKCCQEATNAQTFPEEKNGLSEETLDLIDESRNMTAQGKGINNTESKDNYSKSMQE